MRYSRYILTITYITLTLVALTSCTSAPVSDPQAAGFCTGGVNSNVESGTCELGIAGGLHAWQVENATTALLAYLGEGHTRV